MTVAWSRAVPRERWRHLHKEVASHGVSGTQQGEGSMARCGGVRAWGSEKGIGGGGSVGRSIPPHRRLDEKSWSTGLVQRPSR